MSGWSPGSLFYFEMYLFTSFRSLLSPLPPVWPVWLCCLIPDCFHLFPSPCVYIKCASFLCVCVVGLCTPAFQLSLFLLFLSPWLVRFDLCSCFGFLLWSWLIFSTVFCEKVCLILIHFVITLLVLQNIFAYTFVTFSSLRSDVDLVNPLDLCVFDLLIFRSVVWFPQIVERLVGCVKSAPLR